PRFDSLVAAGRLTADRDGVPPAWGLPELRERIADTYCLRHERSVDPRQEVLVTHGATGAFAAVLDAFVNPGDRVALFDPCSPLFHLGAKSRRARVRWIPTWTEDGRLRFPVQAFERAVRGAARLVLCDPADPARWCRSRAV